MSPIIPPTPARLGLRMDERMNGWEMTRNDWSNAVRFPAVVVTSSTVPSSSSTSTAVLGGGAAGLPPPPPPPIVYRGGDRFYPGGNIHHRPDHHQPGTAAPTLSHVPPPAVYPAHPHPHQPQPPIHNGPPSSITPTKTSTGQKKKNSTYHVVTSLLHSLSVCLSIYLLCLSYLSMKSCSETLYRFLSCLVFDSNRTWYWLESVEICKVIEEICENWINSPFAVFFSFMIEEHLA